MRILQVANGYPHRAYGGVELHTQRLAAALRERGHELAVFTRTSDLTLVDGTLFDETVDGVPVRTVVNDFKGGAFRDHYRNERVREELVRFAREVRPDVVHVQHLIGLSADLPEAARALSIPVVATIHEYWYVCQRVMLQHRDGRPCRGPSHESCIDCVRMPNGAEAPRPVHPDAGASVAVGPEENRDRFRALASAIAAFERIVTPSQFVIDEYARQGMPLPPERTRAVSLGVDRGGFDKVAPVPDPRVRAERPLRLGFVGHQLHHKGPHVLVEALRRVPDLPIELSLWGTEWPDHPYDATLRDLVAREPRARRCGRFADGGLPDVLASFDVLVVPSTCPESFGIATREAFLAGRPVLTSDRGALPESVRDGIDGLVVAGEDPDALAAALLRLVTEPRLLETLVFGAAASRERVKTMASYAAEIEGFLYRPVVSA
ncbi:MAG: glycosyltransferase [Deltaproteobacteria bacterium]|nr:glycosyltransferase [Deltaproteobacteria bacterium]